MKIKNLFTAALIAFATIFTTSANAEKVNKLYRTSPAYGDELEIRIETTVDTLDYIYIQAHKTKSIYGGIKMNRKQFTEFYQKFDNITEKYNYYKKIAVDQNITSVYKVVDSMQCSGFYKKGDKIYTVDSITVKFVFTVVDFSDGTIKHSIMLTTGGMPEKDKPESIGQVYNIHFDRFSQFALFKEYINPIDIDRRAKEQYDAEQLFK